MPDNPAHHRAPPNLPPGAQHPVITLSPYAFPVPQTSPSQAFHTQPGNTWTLEYRLPLPPPPVPPPPVPPVPHISRPRVLSMQSPNPPRPRSAGEQHGSFGPAFPQPNFYRSSSQLRTMGRPNHNRADRAPLRLDPTYLQPNANFSATSFGSYNSNDYGNEGYNDDTPGIPKGLSDSLLQSEDGLKLFQTGALPEADQEWHRLVPVEARDALGKQEVNRQSVIFEVVKSERDYVTDLETVHEVFIGGLRKANPPIITETALSTFITEVFGNLADILAYHKRMLAALFIRQSAQHPLIQSVADIILDTTLKSEFRSAYETYVKHYPLAESHHRNQLKLNRAYESFIQSVNYDPRIRKRDLITFLSRPVTRLPRLNLLLEQTLKLTDKEHDHPDGDTLPMILGILKDLIKSTQPGIEAAEGKVKFWALCESLVFQRGEIIDMGLYEESRSLVYLGPVMRRSKSDSGFTEKWTDLVAALLDNYFILCREETRRSGAVKRILVSRPIPLSFLRLGSFEDQPEPRKEKTDEGGLFDSFRSAIVSVFPFTIYHAANRMSRRYTLCVTTEAVRKKWHTAFADAIGIHQVRQDSNMWFSPQVVTDGFFRVSKNSSQEGSLKLTGKITCAVPFVPVNSSRRFIVVGCGSGIYVGPVHSEQYHCALNHKNPSSLAALTTLESKLFNLLVVHIDSSLLAYSLELLAKVGLGQPQQEILGASIERLGDDNNVIFCRHLHTGGRSLLIYASKRRLGTTVTLHVLEAISSAEQSMQPRRTHALAPRSFRTYGEAGYFPKDAYDIVGLSKTVGICTSGGIIAADPSNLTRSAVVVVPNLQDSTNNSPMAALKSMIDNARTLGFIRVDVTELLIIYDDLGCYIDKHGDPTRQCGYIKWETKVVSYANRNGHVLLFSPGFIEIRNSTTGRIVQVIEGQDIRLMYSVPYTKKDNPILVAMRGSKDDHNGQSEKIMELLETEEINLVSPASATVSSVWDDWDIQ